MARNDALHVLNQTLVGRRNELRKRLGTELSALGHGGSSDSADAAFDNAGEEMTSQLAELEAKELSQIEQALHRLKTGKYGLCAGCNGKIPVARLQALPYSTLCIKCAREAEKDSSWLEDRTTANWDAVRDDDSKEVSIADLEYGYK